MNTQMNSLFLLAVSHFIIFFVTPTASAPIITYPGHHLRGLSRKLQGTNPTISFCPSSIGSDAGLWADLLNVNDPENYQALFLISLDNGQTYVDRSMPFDMVNQNNPVPLEWGYAGFLYVDNWVYQPTDINATHFALYAVPLNLSLTSLRLSTTNGQPLPSPSLAIAYSIVQRTVDLPQCAKDLLEGELPQCTECAEETNTTTQNNNDGSGSTTGNAQIQAKSGSFRNNVVKNSLGVFIAGLFGCLTLKR